VKTIINAIDLMNEKVAKFFSYLSMLLAIQLVYEVICRYIFNKPNMWSFDATYFISSILIVFGLAYTWKMGIHVGVDLFSGKMPQRVKAAIFLFFMLTLFFVPWGNIVVVMFKNAIYSWQIKENSMTGSMPPIYPFKTWMMAGIFLFLVQGVSESLKRLHIVLTGKEIQLQKTGDENL
jgi:TRAP-type mannitol/chloroaromatic compound transport system permease small subunit